MLRSSWTATVVGPSKEERTEFTVIVMPFKRSEKPVKFVLKSA